MLLMLGIVTNNKFAHCLWIWARLYMSLKKTSKTSNALLLSISLYITPVAFRIFEFLMARFNSSHVIKGHSMRWYMRIFFHFLNEAIIKCWIICRKSRIATALIFQRKAITKNKCGMPSKLAGQLPQNQLKNWEYTYIQRKDWIRESIIPRNHMEQMHQGVKVVLVAVKEDAEVVM